MRRPDGERPAIIAGGAIDAYPALDHELPAAAAPGWSSMPRPACTSRPSGASSFDQAVGALSARGPLYRIWLEPPNAPHHGFRGVLAMHGPGDDAATLLVRVDGRLHWLQPAGMSGVMVVGGGTVGLATVADLRRPGR